MKRSLLILFLLISFFSLNSVASNSAKFEGFVEYVIKKGDTLSKIAQFEEVAEIILKVNRIDRAHFIPGKKILVPINEKVAKNFCPVPRKINDKSERVIYFFLDVQYFGAYEKGNLILWGPISSGKRNSTPQGKFYVQWKSKNYFSKKYKAKMNFAVNFYKGFFFHEQSLPGYPVSHGCIRLLRKDAEKIFNWIQRNDPVIITKLKNFKNSK